MFSTVFKSVFGSRNDRVLKRLQKQVQQINKLEESFETLSDEQLVAKTQEFKDRHSKGESLDQLLPEAFATVREASKRVLGMRHFDVQMIGGMVLHEGKIAEMRTGEGKTLVATLAAYLNALSGKGVHVITVNDYLARRDSEWMGRLYGFLGLTTDVVVSGMSPDEKRAAYAADISYGTNNEFGFDYLRDNMAFRADDKVQRELNFAVVDEVDSILIDEARTPLIISGPAENSSELYTKMNKVAPKLIRQEEEEGEDGDYWVDEKGRNIQLSENGHQHIEELLISEGLLEEGDSLYSSGNILLLHHMNAALRAHALFQRDVHYVVVNKQIVIVDEFTGRTMPGRRWSDGLHQAVEAKEGVDIQNENQTLASITFQNYFRMYDKLSGMTGTADTEAFEFNSIYNLEVIVIPTNKPAAREDLPDLVYMTTDEKYDAIAEDIKACKEKKQPCLVGTTSIEISELLSGKLSKLGVDHEVLNAKQHQREAQIVANAGRPGAVTIATNMAGRGTDIVLGGNMESELAELGDDASETLIEETKSAWQKRHQLVLEAGGLHIIGTERHESRRIDNQLRGRSGRQGDPGSSRFYLSLEDNLMRIFASDRVKAIMQKLGMEKGEAIEHPWVTKAIENAQRKVEAHNFDIRKNLLEYDDVANDQRKVIYEQRNELMMTDDVSESINTIREDVVDNLVTNFIPKNSFEEQWDVAGLEKSIESEFGLLLPIRSWLDQDDNLHEELLRKKIMQEIMDAYKDKENQAGVEVVRHFEKAIMLQVLDQQWKDHLASMDYLRQGIHLRGYAQKNPKQEYKREAFEMFTELLERIKYEVVTVLSKVQVRKQEDVEAVEQQRAEQEAAALEKATFQHADPTAAQPDAQNAPPEDTSKPPLKQTQTPFVRQGKKVGRNEPCPCGSGKKYKACHGKIA